jgi:DNA-directed RNA polymerase subunit RPC12/RpoP
VSGRITLHLDPGLGWTKPLTVACCATCGAELARHPNQDRAIRAARRRRCPGCGTRTAYRLPGTTSPATDLALSRGLASPLSRQRQPPTQRPSPTPPATPRRSRPRLVCSSGRSPVMARGSTWQIDMGDGTWAVCCMACRLALYRGDKRTADRVFAGHRCEPVVPLGRRRRRRPA